MNNFDHSSVINQSCSPKTGRDSRWSFLLKRRVYFDYEGDDIDPDLESHEMWLKQRVIDEIKNQTEVI